MGRITATLRDKWYKKNEPKGVKGVFRVTWNSKAQKSECPKCGRRHRKRHAMRACLAHQPVTHYYQCRKGDSICGRNHKTLAGAIRCKSVKFEEGWKIWWVEEGDNPVTREVFGGRDKVEVVGGEAERDWQL